VESKDLLPSHSYLWAKIPNLIWDYRKSGGFSPKKPSFFGASLMVHGLVLLSQGLLKGRLASIKVTILGA